MSAQEQPRAVLVARADTTWAARARTGPPNSWHGPPGPCSLWFSNQVRSPDPPLSGATWCSVTAERSIWRRRDTRGTVRLDLAGTTMSTPQISYGEARCGDGGWLV